jgi:predicted RNase H-like HicB family nuclease
MADGETYEKAVRNAQGVIAEWIETAQELGREIPEPKGIPFEVCPGSWELDQLAI